MKLLTVQCNNCGAPLAVAETTRFVTCAHCSSPLAVERNESSVFTEKLAELSQKTEAIAGDLEAIRVQNEIERLDREWATTVESLLGRDDRGRVRQPPGVGSAVGGLLAVSVGVGWLIVTSKLGAPAAFSWMGWVFVAVGAVGAFTGQSAANRYREAESRHQQARQALVTRLEALPGSKPG